MWKVKKILAPTDLSELSQAGLRTALELAVSQGAEVVVYSVVEGPDAYARQPESLTPGSIGVRPVEEILRARREEVQAHLQQAFPDLVQKLHVRFETNLGSPDENIVEKAAQEGVDIIVMSTQGRTGLGRMLLGSVTEKVVRHAPCQVLSVRPSAGG
jgi:universal stress protein A